MYFLNFLYNNLLLGRIFLLVFNSEMDTASLWQYNFFDPATPIMEGIINFENEPQNEEVVVKRKNLWFYMAEIKNDKFMKKYVLW